MIASVQPNPLTPAEYLAWEAEQPLKYEYLNGEVRAMTGGTLPHNDIAVNLTTALRTGLRETGCKVRMADAKVEISENGPYFYPDIVVSCNEQDRRAMQLIRYPTVIIEVLSPTTAGFDRGDKFKFYRRIPTLQEYVLIEAEKVGIDCYRRGDKGKWELTAYPDEAVDQSDPDILEFSSINFRCPLSLIYEDVEFPQ